MRKCESRSRKQAGKSIQLSETTNRDSEENQVATPESSSWATSERAFGIDNSPNLAAEESHRRKGLSDRKAKNSKDGAKGVAKPKKGERVHKRNIQHSDGAKYMSYIKVSREQHRRVKSTMKHTSNSIQPRSLNNVLGNLESLHVQPFEIFEEEERQKLHAYWLQLANRDVPAGFANWTKKKLEIRKLAVSLGQELDEKMKFQEEFAIQDQEKEISHDIPPEHPENRELRVSPANAGEDEDVENSDSLLQDQLSNQVQTDETAIALEDDDKEKSNCVPQVQLHNMAENIEGEDQSASVSPEDQHLERIVSISSIPHSNSMNLDSCGNDLPSKANEVPPMVSEYPRNLNTVDATISRRDPRESGDVWPGVSVPGPYYHSTVNQGYVSSNEVSLPQQEVIGVEQVQMIDLQIDTHGKDSGREFLNRQPDDLSFYSSYHNQGRNLQEKDAGKELLPRQPDDVPLFSSYPAQDRNELFEAFFKSQDGLPFQHQQKRMGLDFLHSDNLMMEGGQFSGHFREQVDISHHLEMRQKRVNDLYLGQNIQENVYSDEGRYPMPKELPISIQDWGASTNRMLASSQPHLSNGDLMSQNWFPIENRGRNSWSGLEGGAGPSRGMGTESNSDQSFFNVLSDCNELRSGAPYDSMCSAERFMQSAAYNALGGGIPSTSNILHQTANPLHYLGRQEASGGRRANIGWMGLSHQNSGLQESVSKPFVGSWHQ